MFIITGDNQLFYFDNGMYNLKPSLIETSESSQPPDGSLDSRKQQQQQQQQQPPPPPPPPQPQPQPEPDGCQ